MNRFAMSKFATSADREQAILSALEIAERERDELLRETTVIAYKKLEVELETERLKNAACLMAAEGHAKGENRVFPGNPCFTLAYAATVALRRAYEFVAGPGRSPQSVIDEHPGEKTPSEINYAEAERHDFHGR